MDLKIFFLEFSTKLFIASSRHKAIYNYSQIVSQSFANCTTQVFNIKIPVEDIQKPFIFKYEYELKNKIPKIGKKFCNNCVALDPRDKKEISIKLPVTTECQEKICKPDLKLFGEIKMFGDEMIIGKAKNISIHYTVLNNGEPAYSTQFSTKISNSLKYFAIPSSCTQDGEELYCAINSGKPLKHGEHFDFKIILDLSKCDESFSNVFAKVLSLGEDKNEIDNLFNLNLTLKGESEVEVSR